MSPHLKAMRDAAFKASQILMRHYGKIDRQKVQSKALNDFVTFVDRTSQKRIIRSLRKAFPVYGFQAEEEGMYESRERMWIIDPLDGTANYIRGYPLFCISIALTEGKRVLAGLVYDPIHKELFTAERGKGARLNGRKIRVSRNRRFNSAFLATGFPFRWRDQFEPYHKSFSKIFYNSAGIRRGGSAALDLCYTACGRVDGFWEYGLSPWDIAAGILLVEEAGGLASDFAGKRTCLHARDIVAGNRNTHRELKRILKTVRGFR